MYVGLLIQFTYNNNRVPSCNGYDISTGNYTRTNFLHLGLNVINNIKPSNGIIIRTRSFLPFERRSIVQEY